MEKELMLNSEYIAQEGIVKIISNSKRRSKENTGLIAAAGSHPASM